MCSQRDKLLSLLPLTTICTAMVHEFAMMPDKLDAALFDFDGTLVDTMPLHYEAYRRAFAELGIELSPADYYANVGPTARETIPRFLRGRPCPTSIGSIHARKQEIALALTETRIIPRLASAALLPLLYGRVPMAIVSSGSRGTIEHVVERLAWGNYFDIIISGADVQHGKPAPDLFLLAAKQLSVTPKRCLVFEDTDDGVTAARAAGMAVFDVRDAMAPTALVTRRKDVAR